MKNSDVICGALRIVHFEVKEDSGSLTFDRKRATSPRALARG